MKITKTNDYLKTEIVEYNSLNEFYEYITNTKTNYAFSSKKILHSKVKNKDFVEFTGTNSFEEAIELMKYGWEDMAKELNKKLDAKKFNTGTSNKNKSIYSVAGFQPCVPRYLQGIPNNMIYTKKVPVKNKVVTLTKSITYASAISTEKIIKESIKTLNLVKSLEQDGIKVNLNIIVGSYEDKRFFLKIRIKNANERLNVSKLAFPLVHPSMLRRLFFRWVECYPDVTQKFTNHYGIVIDDESLFKSVLSENEYFVPTFVKGEEIENLNDLL